MSSRFDDVTTAAHDLVAAGDLAGAQELLGDALSGADPSPAHASPELTEAASLQARILVTLGDPHAARGWAAFAYAATSRLFGPSDQRTIAAAATLAAVLHRVGSHSRAARLYRAVIEELTAIDGPESLRVLAAHADLATVEYARGECEVARNRLAGAWELHREVYGDAHLGGIKMVARLGAMERDCGGFAEARAHLALAQELCQQHLPADHPLAAQVAGLARAAANPDHVCAATPPVTRDEVPVVPAQPGPAQGDEPPVLPPYGDAPPHDDAPPYDDAPGYPGPPMVPPPRQPLDEQPYAGYRYASLEEEPVEPGDEWWPPEHGPEPDEDDRSAGGAPEPREHPTGSVGPALPPTVPDLTTGTGWYPSDDPADPGDAYPAEPYPAEPYPAEPHSGDRYGTGTAGDQPGVYTVGHLPERRQPAGQLATVYHPPRRAARRMLPAVPIGLVVVLLGTGAAIAGFALVDDPKPRPAATSGAGAPGTTASPPPTATPTAAGSSTAAAFPSPGSPPTGVKLRDSRDSVTLTWTYPTGAEGPVVIAGGRRGQEPQAFQDLPAGSNAFHVYGLNRDLDYCFIVGVVYSADMVGRAAPVCTNRPRR